MCSNQTRILSTSHDVKAAIVTEATIEQGRFFYKLFLKKGLGLLFVIPVVYVKYGLVKWSFFLFLNEMHSLKT